MEEALSSRERFEDFANEKGFCLDSIWSSVGEPYEDHDTRIAYEIWCASENSMPSGIPDLIANIERSRSKYPNNARMFDGLLGEVDELRRAYGGDGDIRAEALDVAVCAFRIAVEGDSGGNTMLEHSMKFWKSFLLPEVENDHKG